MMWSSSKDDLLNIRVEKGMKPRLKLSEDRRTVQVAVPLNTFVNYPQQRIELQGGYFLVLQRLQQQYKIVVQHGHERKPEFVVYVSALSHEKDIKTQVKEMNTRIHQIGIAGPNMDVVGALRVGRLTLEATVGTMHVNAKIIAERLSLLGQCVVVASEALISTDRLTVIGRKLQVDGRCYPNENSENREMSVRLKCGLVHVGIDGCIGESNEKDTTKVAKRVHPAQITTKTLHLTVNGSLANYGKITATDLIDLTVGESLLSLSDGTLDSAGRGYDALKQIRGVRNRAECTPSSTSLHSAISSQNADAVADLIEKGVDLNDKIRSKQLTIRQAAIRQCREKRQQSTLNRVRERITLINALLAVHDWRRGSIESRAIRAMIEKNCDDCAQFNAKELHIKVGGSATVESDSIWSSSYVELDVGTSVTFAGQVKLTSLLLNAAKAVTTTTDAIVALEMFGRLNCARFVCDGIWTVGENFVLDAFGDVHFGAQSYIETEKMEMVSGSTCNIDGSWQIGTCWTLVEAKFTIGATAKLFIEESATIGAHGLMCHGFCSVAEKCDLQLKDSAHFFHSSKLECHTLKIACELHCTLGGVWIADTMNVYVRHDLITTSTGKAAVFSRANLTVGSFRNDALWQVEKDCQIIVGCMEQSEDGTIFVKQKFELFIHRNSPAHFAGRIVCSHLDMRCLRRCQYDGYLKANEAEIYLPYMNESQLIATGQIDILVTPLTLKGNSSFVDVTPTAPHPFPAFILDGRLNVHAVVAPFLAVEFSPESLTRLRGIASTTPEVEFNILMTVGALTTGRSSSLLSVAEDPRAEGIICASTFYHEGQIRFQAEDVHVLAGSLVHKGRLTNCEHKQNHVKRCHMVIEELLLNEGTLACNALDIVGEGVLENRNRIFAVDTMDIRLNNFSNDDGLMESKNSIKLLSATKEWTKLGGSIKAKRSFDLCAHKLDMALNDVHKLINEKKLSFSARSDLIISTNICDEGKEFVVGCAAQSSVAINATMELDRLEVLLGGAHAETPVIFKISSDSDVNVNTFVMNGSASHLVIVLDGVLRSNRVKIADTFKNVTITGKGSLDSQILAADTSNLCFNVYQIIRTNEVFCKSVTVQQDSLLRLKPCEDHDVTTVSCDRMLIEGTVFIERKLLLVSKKSDTGELQIRGPIIGTTPESEMSVESTRVSVSGQVANLKLLEIYARDTMHFSMAKLKNVRTVTVDCAELTLNADVDSCDNVAVNADAVNLSGTCSSASSSGVFSVYCSLLQSSMNISAITKVLLSCRRAASIRGTVENVDIFDVDAKWINNHASFQNCANVCLTAWTVHSSGSCAVNRLNVTALGVVIINNEIKTTELCITSPFVVAVLPSSSLTSEKIELNSLCLCTNQNLEITTGTNFLWLIFEDMVGRSRLTVTQMNTWKEVAALMKDRFSSPTIDVDEVIVGLKYLSDLTVAKIVLDKDNMTYEELCKMSQRFDTTPISLFNTADLVALIHGGRTAFAVSTAVEKNDVNSRRKRKSYGSSLYEGLVQFKSAKYSKESRGSSDTDVGYVSRSSSEELDRSRSPRTPEMPSCSLFNDNHFNVIEEKLEHSFVNDLSVEELNASLIEQEELAEFELLEQEIEESHEGLVRTDYIVCRDERIQLARLRQQVFTPQLPRPKHHFPIVRAPSSNDLVMKRLQVKSTLSNLDLRSFGSETSLTSIDFSCAGDFGSPMQFAASPFQRSRIPRGSFRTPRKITAV